MKKILVGCLIVVATLSASVVERAPWPQGMSMLGFLQKNGLPQKLYWNLDRQDKELCEEIRAGVPYYTMTDDNASTIEQVLIPVNEELQIHIFKEGKNYKLELAPIYYRKLEDIFAVAIEHSPYKDMIRATHNPRLVHAFVDAFKKTFDFTGLRKGDMLAVAYRENLRLGAPWGPPIIEAAMIEKRGKPHFLFRFHDRYYDEKGRELEGFVFRTPVNHVRITSRFTLRRWHPILHRYRAHLGVDFGGRVGTPIYAAANGKIIYSGWIRGYGKVIKIRHRDGFMTLYAHMSRIRGGMHRGRYVKKGQVIGYIGSTGMSTGPHLHFGLYKNGRAINPLGVIKVTKRKLYGKRRRAFLAYAEKMKRKLLAAAKEGTKPHVLDDMSRTRYLIDEAPACKVDTPDANATQKSGA